MVRPATQFPFSKLPPELRTMIFAEFFSSLHVTVHKDSFNACLAKKSSRVTSYCNTLLVSGIKFMEEARNHFLEYATFWIAPDCWKTNSLEALTLIAKDFRHIILVSEAPHSRDLDLTAASITLAHFQQSFNTGGPLSRKFSVLTYDRTFFDDWDSEWEYRHSSDEKILQQFIYQGLQCAQNLVFDMFPDEEDPTVRSCGVSITGDLIKITGFPMRDVRGVAARLCKLINFDASMACYLEYPGETKLMTVQNFSRRKRR